MEESIGVDGGERRILVYSNRQMGIFFQILIRFIGRRIILWMALTVWGLMEKAMSFYR